MDIDVSNPQLAAQILNRLSKEYGDTCAANFALDIICNSQAEQIKQLQEHNGALIETNTNLRNDLDLVRADRDSAKAEAEKTDELQAKNDLLRKQLHELQKQHLNLTLDPPPKPKRGRQAKPRMPKLPDNLEQPVN